MMGWNPGLELWVGILGWNPGLESWVGILGWNLGLELWIGILDCNYGWESCDLFLIDMTSLLWRRFRLKAMSDTQ